MHVKNEWSCSKSYMFCFKKTVYSCVTDSLSREHAKNLENNSVFVLKMVSFKFIKISLESKQIAWTQVLKEKILRSVLTGCPQRKADSPHQIDILLNIPSTSVTKHCRTVVLRLNDQQKNLSSCGFLSVFKEKLKSRGKSLQAQLERDGTSLCWFSFEQTRML